MKSRAFIIFTLLIISACTGLDNESIFRSDDPGLTFKGRFISYRGEKLNGLVEEYFESGVMKMRAHYSNGLENGVTFTWFENGNMESVRSYVNGEKYGIHKGWWPDGKLKFEYHFRNGQYHGAFREWYRNGSPMHLFTYNHGSEVKAIGWRENGKTYINFEVRNGRRYGLTNARLCFSLKDEQGIYKSVINPK